MKDSIRMVAWAQTDEAVEEALLRPAGAARKVVASMIATTPGLGGGGGGIGFTSAPFRVDMKPNGEGELVILDPQKARIETRPDGAIDLVFAVGG